MEKDPNTEVQEEKKINWRRIVIISGAIIGGAVGWYSSNQARPGIDMVIGIIIGTYLARWLWDHTTD